MSRSTGLGVRVRCREIRTECPLARLLGARWVEATALVRGGQLRPMTVRRLLMRVPASCAALAGGILR